MTNIFRQYASLLPIHRSSFNDFAVYDKKSLENKDYFFKYPNYLPQTEELQFTSTGKLYYAGYENVNIDLIERMKELDEKHLISLDFKLNYDWKVQMYHLLSINHLKEFHKTLNGLTILGVNSYEKSQTGGSISFDTVTESQFKLMRIFRSNHGKVRLTLHSAFTVELNIILENGKFYSVMFNVCPISDNQHKFYIDIYGDVAFKGITSLLLRIASILTVLEDIPYYNLLTKRNIKEKEKKLVPDNSKVTTNSLLYRFFELYGNNPE
jgi:hypothetical protein